MSKETGTPKIWRDMTDEEKGALLLAHLEGKVIECWTPSNGWRSVSFPPWSNGDTYRVKDGGALRTMQYRYKVTESRFLPNQEDLNKMAENGYRLVNIQQRNGKVYIYWEIKFD